MVESGGKRRHCESCHHSSGGEGKSEKDVDLPIQIEMHLREAPKVLPSALQGARDSSSRFRA